MASRRLTASQLRSQELFAEKSGVQTAHSQTQQQLAGAHQQIAGLQQQSAALSQQLMETETQMATANTRIDNLLAERNELKSRYAGRLLDTSSDQLLAGLGVPTQTDGFEYDELTGLNRFPEMLHFDLGSAQLRPEAAPVLKEFANQANSESTQDMRILIVGHTDDQRIASSATARQHPTNWHLSTDRADQVVLELQRLGISPERMATMGYSRYQPLEVGTDETSRQRNRRVELYLVPASSNVAKWDPVRSLN